jgi:HTH-type biofilm formation transcriptional regulator
LPDGPDDLHRRLARRIDDLRKRKGWSINRLADFAGMSNGYLWKLLHGQKSPTVRMLQRIAGALDTDVPSLFRFAERDRARGA